jgi:hypothetical protein
MISGQEPDRSNTAKRSFSAFFRTRARKLQEDDTLVEKNALYRCLDKGLFSHLRHRWQDLFGVKFDVLLYDLTSTYFESPPPEDKQDNRRFGHSRDKRKDCVQRLGGEEGPRPTTEEMPVVIGFLHVTKQRGNTKGNETRGFGGRRTASTPLGR